MAFDPMVLALLLVGLAAGLASGFFGIGGGLVIVPALVYLLGFSQHQATGTSLAVLLPPVGLGAVIEYYRHGNLDLRAALFVALGLFVGGWISAAFANQISGPHLRLGFGLFAMGMGGYMAFGAVRRLGWL
jgi:uncharacterized protein